MNKRYYAIRWKNGNKIIKYGYWVEIKQMVVGINGVVYKGFDFKKQAQEWLNKQTVVYRKNDNLEPDKYYIFVDGSFTKKTNRSGWGWVCIKNNQIIAEDFGCVENITGSRNIIGELEATIQGISWSMKEKLKEIIIVHDYIGISCWALGLWDAKKFVAQEYVDFIKNTVKKKIKLRFEKVGGHSGIKWNEYADYLSRKYMEKLNV
jgi:ribonuclease HI